MPGGTDTGSDSAAVRDMATLTESCAVAADDDIDAFLQQARKASELLKTLSHEVRLSILCRLLEGEKSVSELERILSMPQAAVSRHLARLRADQLVSARRDGKAVIYGIANDKIAGILSQLYEIFCGTARSAPRG